MLITNHAKKRLTQRCINPSIIDIVYEKGKITKFEQDGTMIIAYSKEEYHKDRAKLLFQLRLIEEALDRHVVMTNNREVITVY